MSLTYSPETIPLENLSEMEEMLKVHEIQESLGDRWQIHFYPERYGEEDRELGAYNPSSLFFVNGRPTVFVRNEHQLTGDNAHFRAYNLTQDLRAGTEDLTIPIYGGEDPRIAVVHNKIFVSSVVTYTRTVNGKPETEWHTRFLSGSDLQNLEYFADSPIGDKDDCLLELPSGEVLFLTRSDRPKRIRASVLDSPNRLADSKGRIARARILENLCPPGEDWWVGANQALLLENGEIGVIAHMGYRIRDTKTNEPIGRIYWPLSFELNSRTFAVRNYKVYPAANPTAPRSPRHLELTAKFPSGLVFDDKSMQTAVLIQGHNDCEVLAERIEYPFSVGIKPKDRYVRIEESDTVRRITPMGAAKIIELAAA